MNKSLTMALTLAITSQFTHSATLSVSDAFIAIGDGTNPVDPAFNILPPSNGSAFDYIARERQNSAQLNRRAVTFLNFDTSSITFGEANDPGFSATFTIDHVGHLNNLNSGMDLSVGVNASGAWNSTTTLPAFAWAAASTNQSVILADIHTVAGTQSLSLDVTSLVQGWVNTPSSNQGLVLFGTRATANDGNNNFSQASHQTNAAINTAVVPEPSSFALLALGLLPLARRKR